MNPPADRPGKPSRLPFEVAYWIVVGPLILVVIIAVLVAHLKFRADRHEAHERAWQSEAAQPQPRAARSRPSPE